MQEALDIHRWSDHPEVNVFVDAIFEEHFNCKDGNPNIRKKHLKVILLDLYIAWCEAPDLKIAYPRDVTAYKAKSIYNELHISRMTPLVVDTLFEAGLVEQAIGFNDRKTGAGFTTRMWATKALISQFKAAKFSLFDISYSSDRLPVCLRDENGKDIEDIDLSAIYSDVIEPLNRYNGLLRRTFIAVPDLDNLVLQNDVKNPPYAIASQAQKFVRRVFNRSSFDLGGRFSGAWWQNCPKEIRSKIFINDCPTIEIDYSSLHPTILYAQRGINYWAEIGSDPYQLPELDFQKDPSELRHLAKLLMLILLNAPKMDTRLFCFGQIGIGTRLSCDTVVQIEKAQLCAQPLRRHTIRIPNLLSVIGISGEKFQQFVKCFRDNTGIAETWVSLPKLRLRALQCQFDLAFLFIAKLAVLLHRMWADGTEFRPVKVEGTS